jgi:hypothetical protein
MAQASYKHLYNTYNLTLMPNEVERMSESKKGCHVLKGFVT